MDKSIFNIRNFNILDDELRTNFSKVNKENSKNIYESYTYYEEKMKYISSDKKRYINLLDISKYDILFNIFNYDVSQKSITAKQISQNINLYLLIKKIFLFGIKYYNCFENLNVLEEKVKLMKIENTDDIKKNIDKIRLLDKYSLFFSFYQESLNFWDIYNKHRSKFNISNFDEENKKYFDDNLKKIQFFYDNITPCDNLTIEQDTLIIKNLNELMENSNIGINEIIQFSRIQNIFSQIKLIKLTIVNNLLLYLSNESNIIFILYLMRKKYNHKSIILNSIFDDIYAADYSTLEKMTHQFHLFLDILSYKLTDKKNNYSDATQIALCESLIWKIKKKNFPILTKLIQSFEEIKTEKRKNNDNYLSDFNDDKVYNVIYYNWKKKLECKFEVFSIFVHQIIKIIKDFLKYKNEKNEKLILEKNPSVLLENDFKKILENILSYFVDINPECYFYNDLILLFYKIFNNSDELFNYIFQFNPNVITKIIKISFNNNKEINNNENKKNILIMLKLLCQIIENISEDNLKYLSIYIEKIESSNSIIQNPLIYLYQKILNDLINNSNNLEIIILKYYKNLLFLCLKKIFEYEKDEKILNKIINDNNFFVLLLSDDTLTYTSENKIIIKSDNYKYEDLSLFNSEINRSSKVGKIICFLDDKFKNYVQIISDIFYRNHKNNIFEKSSFLYDSNNIYKNVLIIMEDFEQFNFYDINNFDIKELSKLEFINTENRYKKNFIENHSKLILTKLKDELLNDKLNEKGFYLVLKILQQLIKYIGEDDLILFFKYIWDYYVKYKSEENNYPFMSLEYIEEEIRQYFQFYNIKNIFNEKENNNKSLYSLFNWIINNNILEIKRNLEYRNTSYKIDLINPKVIEDVFNSNSDIRNIYKKSFKLSNLSIYIGTYKIINGNSILFSNFNLNDNDITNLIDIIQKNINKIEVIIVRKVSKDIDQNNLIDFIVSYSIPIYEIRDNYHSKLFSFFINGQGLKYLKIYHDNMNNLSEKDTIFHLIKADYEKKIEVHEEDTLEKIVKDKIKSNKFYKSSLCKNYDKGNCWKGDKCNFAHGVDELNKIKKIKNNLTTDEKEEKLKKNKTNIDKITSELNDESKCIFNILNIKMCKRMIFEFLYKNDFVLSEKQNLLEDIYYIYDALCLEYHFNCISNISNESLKEKLLSYFKKLCNMKEKVLSENKWILRCFKQIEKINYNQQEFSLDSLSLRKLNNEKKLIKKFAYSSNVLYDKLLFLLDIINKENRNEYFINYYFDIISNILNHMIIEDEYLKSNINNSEENYDCLMLTKIMNILYNHFYNKLTDIESKNGNKIIESSFSTNNIDEIMKKLIKINLKDYFPENNNNRDFSILDNISKKKMEKKTAFLTEFIFKYFDFCLFLLYKEEQTKFFDYMTNSENLIFKYYIYYKILTLEKNNKNIYYKDSVSFIYYIVDLISSNNNQINDNGKTRNIIDLTSNKIKEYELKSKSDICDVTLKIEENIYIKKFKIILLNFDDKIKKYYFQDIVDFNSHLVHDNIYKLKVKNNLFLVPLKNIDTKLYSIENSSQILVLENKNNNLLICSKYEDTPKYSWNIGYGGNRYLLLSEKDNKIYNFLEEENNREIIKEKFNIDNDIELINDKDNKIIDFIDGAENYSSFAFREDEKVFILDKNKKKYKWLNDEEKSSITYPIFIPSVEIKYISANSKDCYAIGKNGKLYEKKGPNFKKLNLPENSLKFLQCTCGNGYVICLVQNNRGKGVIYAKGINNEFQCGINNLSEGDHISKLTKCEIDEDLDFKYISTYKGFSAALTTCGLLYVWGKKFFIDGTTVCVSSPWSVNKDKANSIKIDEISLNNEFLYAIGRKLENGNFIKQLFILEDNNSKEDSSLFILKEINIIDKEDNKSRIMPIKILIGENRTYFLCVNENKFIEEIVQNNKKNEDEIKIKIEIWDKIERIERNKKEEYNLLKMKKIYSSNCIDKFINSFNSFSDKNLRDLLKVFDGITREDIKINDIDYNELILYMKGKDEFNDLTSFFLNNEKNEGIALFNYLKIRIANIRENIINFLYINNSLKSENYISNIIEQNISYLNDDYRVTYFLSVLFNIIDSENFHNPFVPYDLNNNRSITIDRFKANNFKEKYKENKVPDIVLNETIFGQLFHYLDDLSGKKFLKEKGKKLFKVNLKGEHAIDEGGPYSEILSDICDDLQSDYIELFIKTPNNKYNTGEYRDRFIVNPNCNNIVTYHKAFEFIGKLMALAISSGETLNLNLHPIVWKGLVENKITFEEYETIDINFYNFIKELKNSLSKKDKKELIDSYDLNFVIRNLNEKETELVVNGKNIKVNSDNAEIFINLAQSTLIEEIQSQINYIKKGLYSAIGKNLLKILNWEQLEEMVCGEVIFNMEDFKKNTKYKEGEKVIQWFWEWLENCSEKDKFKYLKFVSGRSRLPKSKYEHIINIIDDKNKLPASHTCFSTLDLPNYDSKEILFNKMKYVIENVTNITDR